MHNDRTHIIVDYEVNVTSTLIGLRLKKSLGTPLIQIDDNHMDLRKKQEIIQNLPKMFWSSIDNLGRLILLLTHERIIMLCKKSF